MPQTLSKHFKVLGIIIFLFGVLGTLVSLFAELNTSLKPNVKFLEDTFGTLGVALALIGPVLARLPGLTKSAVDTHSFMRLLSDLMGNSTSSTLEGKSQTTEGLDTGRVQITKPSRTDKHLSRNDQRILRWLVTLRNGILGGLLTGPVFLFCYYLKDFGNAHSPDISERYIQQICPDLHLNTPASVVKDYPSFLKLLPEFVGFGLLVGLIIGGLLPLWRTRFLKIASSNPNRWWLRSPYLTTILFGLFWGGLLGAAANPAFFGQSDGRPFMKVSTASFAAQICITAYLLFELMAFRRDLTLRAIQQTIKLGIYALVIPLLVLSLDHFGNFSGWSYCQFYASWDPMKREIVPGLRPILVGAGYGAWIGFIVMWVVGGYLAAIEAMRRRKRALG